MEGKKDKAILSDQPRVTSRMLLNSMRMVVGGRDYR